MQEGELCVNQAPVIGHVPGIPIGRRFYGRCEVAAVGLHNHWLNGISYVAAKDAAKLAGAHSGAFAVSIVVSGGYEDDEDDGVALTYTGQGGNDLLGKKQQVKDQGWERGNAALRNNIAARVPVRVTRGNSDPEALYGKVFIYDGLYDVLEAAETVGVSGCVARARASEMGDWKRQIKAGCADRHRAAGLR
jgi:euchromatic histone-lysine N-methyltransferase